jgi:hypothetical protein
MVEERELNPDCSQEFVTVSAVGPPAQADITTALHRAQSERPGPPCRVP